MSLSPVQVLWFAAASAAPLLWGGALVNKAFSSVNLELLHLRCFTHLRSISDGGCLQKAARHL